MRLGVNGRFLAAPRTGVQRFALEVLRRLPARVPTTLFLPAGVEPPADLPAPRSVVRGRWSGPLWEQAELPGAIARSGVDVTLHPANAAPLLGGPHVVVLHDLLPWLHPGDYSRAYRWWVRIAHLGAARRAAGVATVSRWSAETLAPRLRRAPEDIPVVLQGPDPFDSPAPPAEVQAVLRRLRVPTRYFLALTAGAGRKGGRFLREIWAGWRPPSRCALVEVGHEGDGASSRESSPATILRLGRVTDHELRCLYSGALALLHPSEAEGFGRPPLEALASATRVIAADYGAAREVLGDAADILPRDVDAWRVGIQRVAAEPPAQRAARIAAGRTRAAGFRWDDGVDLLLAYCASRTRRGRGS